METSLVVLLAGVLALVCSDGHRKVLYLQVVVALRAGVGGHVLECQWQESWAPGAAAGTAVGGG